MIQLSSIQENNYEEVESKLEASLTDMEAYYKRMKLKFNPVKTQIRAFHLRNRQATRNLDITWERVRR